MHQNRELRFNVESISTPRYLYFFVRLMSVFPYGMEKHSFNLDMHLAFPNSNARNISHITRPF